jgi:hypothetical protein
MMRIPSGWRRVVDPLAIGLVGIAACALQSIVWGRPVPAVHDEFSYLLTADTFLHGRCANTTHPLWQHFESMHILLQPTYASKYPPGQGLFLALGWLAGGHPIVGVWLGVGLACGAIAWMLRAAVPAGWAALGGLVAACRLGFGEWGWDYWGGGVAAAGGALFIGGWFRVVRKPRAAHAAVMAIGLVLLAISRPFEGLLLCIPVGVATLSNLVRHRFTRALVLRHIVAPALVVLLPATLALGYYNARVTDNPLRLPYMEHARQYGVAPVLIVQEPRPEPEYRHAVLREFYVNSEYATYRIENTYDGWALRVKAKLQMWWKTYLGYGLSASLFALPCVLLLSPRTRFALAACILVLGFVATLETWGFSHYTAPVAALVYLVIVQAFRCISLFEWRGWPIGRSLVAVWLSGCVLAPGLNLMSPFHEPGRAWAPVRARIESDLRAHGHRHLVVVRYGPNHRVHEEWVYNAANIDEAPVVWAREMSADMQARLLDYYSERTIWLLEEDGAEPRLTRLSDPPSSASGPSEPGH